jgi:hypothetical protein
MSKPVFPDPIGRRELLNPGAVAHKAGLSLEERVKALEQAALSRPGPGITEGSVPVTDFAGVGNVQWLETGATYAAGIYLANSGSPTHTSSANWQKVGSGGGSATWTAWADLRPSGVSSQVDTANGILTIRRSGIYVVIGAASFSSISDAKIVAAGMYLNGSRRLSPTITTGVTSPPRIYFSGMFNFAQGDDIELYAYQNDSASEAYDTVGLDFNFLRMVWIGGIQ